MEQVQIEKQIEKRLEGTEVLRYLEDMIRYGYKIVDVRGTKVLLRGELSIMDIILLYDFDKHIIVSFEVFKDNNCIRIHSSDYEIDKSVCVKLLNRYYMKKVRKIKTISDFEEMIKDFISE